MRTFLLRLPITRMIPKFPFKIMSYKQLKEKYNEGKEEHFDDPYDYIRYLERCGDKSGANQVRRKLRREEENENNNQR